MKKKLLVTLLVIMAFTCLLAIHVSADTLVPQDTSDYGTVSTIDSLESSKPTSFTDYTSKAVLVGTDGKYYTVPSYYVLADNTTFTWNLVDEIKTLTGASNASSLKNFVVRMEIPEGITSMSTGRFDSSSSLVAVKMPTTLTGELGSATFKKCSQLTTVENLENTTITSLSISNGTNRNGVFSCSPLLTSVSLPSTIKAIGKWSFTECYALTTVNVPEDAKITTIGSYAFEKATALKSFYFSSTLETMEEGAFSGCSKLTTLINLENTKITKLDGNNNAVQGGAGVFSNCSLLTAISLPSTITYIERWAAGSCTSLTSLTIPEDAKITFIGKYAFEKTKITEVYLPSTLETLEIGAFSNCSNLATVENLGNTQITEIGEYTFQNAPITQIQLPATLKGTIGQYAFGGNCAVQDRLVIPNGVTGIAKCAFAPNQSKSAIKEIVLPASLTTLGVYPFEKNDNTNVIYIPATVTSIPQGFFSNWGSNFVVVYTGDEAQLNTLIANSNTSANAAFTTDAVKTIKSAEEYGEIVPANVTGKSIVYGYNVCKAFYEGNHMVANSTDCTDSGTCVNCTESFESKFIGHNLKKSYLYPDGFAKAGVYTCACQNTDFCTVDKVTTEDAESVLDPIITPNGISLKVEGTAVSVTAGFLIDNDALDRYNGLLTDDGKESLNVGLFIANSAQFGEATGFVNAEGELQTTKGFQVSIENGYSIINSAVRNFKATEQNKTLALIYAIYVVDNGDVSYVSVNNSVGTEVTVGTEKINAITIMHLDGVGDVYLPDSFKE